MNSFMLGLGFKACASPLHFLRVVFSHSLFISLIEKLSLHFAYVPACNPPSTAPLLLDQCCPL
jgi:hypothetical protein